MHSTGDREERRQSLKREENDATPVYNMPGRIRKEKLSYNRQKERRLIDGESFFFILSSIFKRALFAHGGGGVRGADHKIANLCQGNLSSYRGNLASWKRLVASG